MRRLTPALRLAIGLGIVLMLGLATLVALPALMIMGTTAVSTDEEGAPAACGPVANVSGRTITLDDDQITNARTIVQTGRSLQVPDRGLVVAVATALQESTLQNLDWGDLDSLGLFQQRAAWGPASVRTDPAASAAMFYTGGRQGQPGLLDIDGWASMPITVAAQAVQVSAFPTAYAKWETLAASLVGSVIGQDPLQCDDVTLAGLPGGDVGAMLKVAMAQLGKPYLYGATGPDAFDCSGLVLYSWRQAGYTMNIRTAAQMWENSTPVARGQEQPGDMIFGSWGENGAGAGHVMIVVSKGLAVQAPSTGRNVERFEYGSNLSSSWRFGRFKPSVLTKLPSPA